MSFFIGLLSVILALDCLLLILLVLVQLPKKEAGAGLAFGGSATDALFGAGSGNALTKITKYAAGIFFALAVVISLLHAHMRKSQTSLTLPQNWQSSKSAAPAAETAPAPAPAAAPSTVTAPTLSSNATLSIPVPAAATNAPAK